MSVNLGYTNEKGAYPNGNGYDNANALENGQTQNEHGQNGHIQNGHARNGRLSNGKPDTFSQEDEYKRAAREKRDLDPFFYCRWVAERPGRWFAITLGAQLFMVTLMVVLFGAGVDVLPFTLDRVPLEIETDPDYLRALAWDEKKEDTNIKARFAITENLGGRTETFDILNSYYYQPGGNVLTKENLMLIDETEKKLYNNEKFQEKFCQLNRLRECEKPNSLIRYFDGTYKDENAVFDDKEFNNVVGVLYLASILNSTKRQFEDFMGKNAIVNKTHAISEITRSGIKMGYPLDGYSSTTDREDDQEVDVQKFCLDDWNPVIEKIYKDGVGEMEYYYTSLYLLQAVITRQVIYDQALAGGSLLFIFVFMCIQTGSIWVTAWSMFSVLTGFVTTILLYRFPFDFRYFGVFHVLAVFIVLGIGADNIFVFFDTWKATGKEKYKSLAHRLSGAYRKAAMAMFFTSATTATAFIVSATSPFLGVSSFGVFSGVLILVNYLSVIIFVPTVIMTYHMWWDKKRCCCCCLKPDFPDPETTDEPNEEQKRWIVKFFSGPFYSFITHKYGRFVIIFLLVALLGFLAGYSSKLEVQEEQIKLFRDNSNWGKYQKLTNTAFKTNEINVQVLVTWGLKEQDLSDCHHSDADCFGKTVWDDSFSMNSVEAQKDLLDFCQSFKNLDEKQIEKMALKTDIVTKKPEVKCFIDEMKTFYENEGDRLEADGSRRYPAGTKFSFPLTESDGQTIVDHTDVFDGTRLTSGYRWFDLSSSYFFMNGFDLRVPSVAKAPYMLDYNDRIGEEPETPYTTNIQLPFPQPTGESVNVTYRYGQRMRYMSIIANLTLSPNTLGYPTAGPIRDEWEDYVSEKVSKMSPGMQGGVQCTPEELVGFNAWHWLKTQEKLVQSAVIGIVVGIGIAFPILVFATGNILVGTYATITIIFVVVSVLGFIPLAGWKLGVMESINLVLVVGLSVDYVVHLAEGYCRSFRTNRMDRAKDMLEEVGVSVLSGAITTMGAAALLLIAQIVFFFQFGLFIFCTIMFSITYALLLFCTFMALAGPNGDTGSIKPAIQKVKNLFNKCRGKSGTITSHH